MTRDEAHSLIDGPNNSPKEQLVSFIDLANRTSSETISAFPDVIEFLAEVDDLYVRYLCHAGGMKIAASAILLMSAHATFRAAIGLALSGQLLPVFMTLRGGIESALYANAIAMKPELQEVWLNRENNASTRDSCRKQFSAENMFRALTKAHHQEFSDGVRTLYDAAIDFGAHPNTRSVIGSTSIHELKSGAHLVEFAYIHGADSFEVRQSILACAETGIAILFIALILFSDHPSVTDLNLRGLDLHDRLPAILKSLGFGDRIGPELKA